MEPDNWLRRVSQPAADQSRYQMAMAMAMRLIRRMVTSSTRPQDGIVKKQYYSDSLGFFDTKPISIICPWYKLIPLEELTVTPPETSYEILAPGMILFRNYVTLKDQVDIVNICQKWGMEPGGFDEYPSDQAGIGSRFHMCFGRNWDPETRYNNPYRCDGSEPPPIPSLLTSLAEAAVQDAQAHLHDLPSMRPDTCSVNFYTTDGRLDLHQDIDESPDSLQRGLPVVSISMGEWAEFLYGHTTDENKLNKVFLRSGDVLIFGGKSRLIYHMVRQISVYFAPKPLLDATALRMGRLNLTLKQF